MVMAVPRQASRTKPSRVRCETPFISTSDCAGNVARRPEVEDARLAVEVPLARSVNLAEEIERIEPLADAIAVVVVGRLDGDEALVRVNGLDGLPLVAPVPEPVAVDPGVLVADPASGAVALVEELAGLRAFGAPDVHGVRLEEADDPGEALVRPAGQGHRLVVEEEFEAPAARRAIVGDAEGLEVGLDHLAAGGRVEAVEDGLVGYRSPVVDQSASAQSDLVAFLGAVENWRVGGAGVVLGQFQWSAEFVGAAADQNQRVRVWRTAWQPCRDCRPSHRAPRAA